MEYPREGVSEIHNSIRKEEVYNIYLCTLYDTTFLGDAYTHIFL